LSLAAAFENAAWSLAGPNANNFFSPLSSFDLHFRFP